MARNTGNLGIDNHNPLNIKSIGDHGPNVDGSGSNWKGVVRSFGADGGTYPEFDSDLNGTRAALLNMWTKMHRPQHTNDLGGRLANTPALLAQVWTATRAHWDWYGKQIADAIGIGVNDRIDFNNVNHVVRAFRAIEKVEVGRNFVSDEDLARAVKEAYEYRGLSVSDEQIAAAIKAVGTAVSPEARATQGTVAGAEHLLNAIYRFPDIARALTPGAGDAAVNPSAEDVDNVRYEPAGVAPNGTQYFRAVGFVDPSKAEGRPDPKGQLFERSDNGFRRVLQDTPGGPQLQDLATKTRDALRTGAGLAQFAGTVQVDGKDGSEYYSNLAWQITAAEMQDSDASSTAALARSPADTVGAFSGTAAAVKKIETELGRRLSAEEFYLAHHLSRKNIDAGVIGQTIKAMKDNPTALMSTALSAETIAALGPNVSVATDGAIKRAVDGTFDMADLGRWAASRVQFARTEEGRVEARRTESGALKIDPQAETLANIRAMIRGNPTLFGSRQQIDAAILAELKRTADPANPARGINAYLTHEVMRYMQQRLNVPDLAARGIDVAKYNAERGVLSQEDIDKLVAEAKARDASVTDVSSLVTSGRLRSQTAADGTVSYIDPERAHFGEQSRKVHQLVADTLPEKVNDPAVVEGTPVSEVARDYRRGRESAEQEAAVRRQEENVRNHLTQGGLGSDIDPFLLLIMGLAAHAMGRPDLANRLFDLMMGGGANRSPGGRGSPTSSAADRDAYRRGQGPTNRYERRRDVEEKAPRDKPPFGSGYPTGGTDIIPEVSHRLPVVPADKGGTLYQQFWIPSRGAPSTGLPRAADGEIPPESAKGVLVIVNRDTGKVLYAAEHPAEIRGVLGAGGEILSWGTTSGGDRDMQAYWDAYAYILGSQDPSVTANTTIPDIVKLGQQKLDQVAQLNPADPEYKKKLEAIVGTQLLPAFMTTLDPDPRKWPEALRVRESQPINGKVDTNFTPIGGLDRAQYGITFGSEARARWAAFIKTRDGAIPAHLLPVEAEGMRVTSHRGPRWGKTHDGIDFGDGSGRLHRIVASADGIVLAIQDNGNDNASYITIGHSDGSVSVMRHIRAADGIRVGQEVKQGQWVATMGRPTEIHMHYERWDRFGRHAPMDFAGIGDIADSSKFPKVDIAAGTPRFGIAQSRAAIERIKAEIAERERAAAAAAQAAQVKSAEVVKLEAELKAAEAAVAEAKRKAEDAARAAGTADERARAAGAADDAVRAAEVAKAAAAKARDEAKAAEGAAILAKTVLDEARARTVTPEAPSAAIAGPETGRASVIPNGAATYADELRRWQEARRVYLLEQAKQSPPAAAGRVQVPHPYPTRSIVNAFSLPEEAKARATPDGWVFYTVAHSAQGNPATGWVGEVGFYNIKTNEHIWFPASGGGKGPENMVNGSTPGMIDRRFNSPGPGVNAVWGVSFEGGHRFDPANGVIRLREQLSDRNGFLIHTDFGSFRNSNGCPHVPAAMIPYLMETFRRTGVSDLSMLNMPLVKQRLEEAERARYQRPAQPIAARANGLTPELALTRLNEGWVPLYYGIKTGVDLKGIKAMTVIIDPDNATYGGKRLSDMSVEEAQAAIKELREGGRTVIAYRSVGEAQNYSWYWTENNWSANPPSFVKGMNPNWPGNFRVDFTSTERVPVKINGEVQQLTWSEIVQRDLQRAADLKFDGVYLDVVDVYPHVGRTAGQMVDFIDGITKNVRAAGLDVISQNALPLFQDPRMLKIVSGLGVESTFTEGGSSVNWTASNLEVIQRLVKANGASGRPFYVLGTDYPHSAGQRDDFVTRGMQAGIIPFVGDPAKQLDGSSWNDNQTHWAQYWAKLSSADKAAFARRLANVAVPGRPSVVDGISLPVEGEVRVTQDPRRASFAVVTADPADPRRLKLVRGNNPDSMAVHPASTMKMVTLWNACRILKEKDPSGALLKQFLDRHADTIEVMMHGNRPDKPNIDYDATASTIAIEAAKLAGLPNAHLGGRGALDAFMQSANQGVQSLGISSDAFMMTGPGGSGRASPRAIASVSYVAQRDFRDVLERFSRADGNRYAPGVYKFNPALTRWGKPGDWNGNYSWAGANSGVGDLPGYGYAVFSTDQAKLKAGIAEAETRRVAMPRQEVEPVRAPVAVAEVRPAKAVVDVLDAGHGFIPDPKREPGGSRINHGGGSIPGVLTEFEANMLQVYAIGIEAKKAGRQPAYTHLTHEQNLALIRSGRALPDGITEDDVRRAQSDRTAMDRILRTHRWYGADPATIRTRFDWRIESARALKAAGYDVRFSTHHHNSSSNSAEFRGAETFTHVDAPERSFVFGNVVGDVLKNLGEYMSTNLSSYIEELRTAGRLTPEKSGWLLGNVAVHKGSPIQPIPYRDTAKPEWSVTNGLGDIPSVMVEWRYATNPDDAALMQDPVARFASARRMVQAMAEYDALLARGVTTIDTYKVASGRVTPAQPEPERRAGARERTVVLAGADLARWRSNFGHIFRSEGYSYHLDSANNPTSAGGLTMVSLIQSMAQFPALFTDPKWQNLKESLQGYQFGTQLSDQQKRAATEALKSATLDDVTQVLYNKFLVSPGIIRLPEALRDNVLDMAFNSSVEQSVITLRRALNTAGFTVPAPAAGVPLTDDDRRRFGRIDDEMMAQVEAWIKKLPNPAVANNGYALARIRAYEDMVRLDNGRFESGNVVDYRGHSQSLNGWRNRAARFIVEPSTGRPILGDRFMPDKQAIIGWTDPRLANHGPRRHPAPPANQTEVKEPLEVYWNITPARRRGAGLEIENPRVFASLGAVDVPAGIVLTDYNPATDLPLTHTLGFSHPHISMASIMPTGFALPGVSLSGGSDDGVLPPDTAGLPLLTGLKELALYQLSQQQRAERVVAEHRAAELKRQEALKAQAIARAHRPTAEVFMEIASAGYVPKAEIANDDPAARIMAEAAQRAEAAKQEAIRQAALIAEENRRIAMAEAKARADAAVRAAKDKSGDGVERDNQVDSDKPDNTKVATVETPATPNHRTGGSGNSLA